jgi:hypothetical protein
MCVPAATTFYTSVWNKMHPQKDPMGGLASKLGVAGDGQIDLKPLRGPQNLTNCCMNCLLIGRCGPYRGWFTMKNV